MIVYYVEVPGMTVEELESFVRDQFLSADELLRKAREEGSPDECGECGATLQEFVNQYKTIPSDDFTIRFELINGIAYCSQNATGGGDCRRIKDALRKIVQAHIAEELRKAGHICKLSEA